MNISVDQNFVKFGNKSYATNKINSVEIRDRQPHGIAGLVIFIILALFFGIAAIGDKSGSSFGFGVTAIICAGIAWLFWQWHQIIEYQLFLMTSSSEAQAFISRDSDQVLSLKEDIERAMMGKVIRVHDREDV